MTNKNMSVAALTAPVMIALLLLCIGSQSVMASNEKASAATADVKIDNFSFGPQTITVPQGTTVIWTNRDDIPHTSVSTEGVFKSKVMDTDEKFSYTFTKAGTYPYYCTIHPKDDRPSRGSVITGVLANLYGDTVGTIRGMGETKR